MIGYIVGSLAGRVAVVLCVVVVALPYVLRRTWLSRNFLSRKSGLVQDAPRPYLRRLTPHFWVGYAILALSTVHAGTVMRAMSRANVAGIWAATAAFLLLVFEVVLGLNLKEGSAEMRHSLRRVHFWTMIIFVGVLGIHLWLNS